MKPVLALVFGLVIASVLSLTVTGIRGSDGQIQFVPVEVLEAGDPGVEVLQVVIRGCAQTAEGLRVVGWVKPDLAHGLILVTEGAPEIPGVRVGAGQARDSGELPGAQEGDFTIVLPWAGLESQFAVAASPSGFGRRVVGPASKCPEGATQAEQ